MLKKGVLIAAGLLLVGVPAAVTWVTSDIRAYLNGEFLNTFSEAERARIAETAVINDDNQWFDASGGENTTDRMFLLSLDEVVRYFGDSGQLRNRPAHSYL